MTKTTIESYQAFCRSTILGARSQIIDLEHAVYGACSEVGELADQLKRHKFYGKPLDLLNLKEECGDVLWYLSLLSDAAGFTLMEAMEANVRKLELRRATKNSTDLAARDLAGEREALAA